jgi:hypothetical protein
MNAILRECEAVVLTNEAIEVHLSYLRPAVEAVDKKIDQANKDRIAGEAMLAGKIDKANDRISKVQGSIEGLKWFIASIAVILSSLSIAHTFGWI